MSTKKHKQSYIVEQELKEIAPFVSELIEQEAERQSEKLIMIASESRAPKAVREALGSVFQNIYAEGYPRRQMMRLSESELSDIEYHLAYTRRYADRRFYKGTEFADVLESLAGRLAADCFYQDNNLGKEIHANVQALSGSAANLSVYEALLKDGDTIMGMDLFQGGHLTHGSKFNRSGKKYNVVSYGISPETEKLDYSAIAKIAEEHRPKIIVAGFTSYPWAPDFQEFRKIADSVGAYLMADISHTAGLAIAGLYPNPVYTADVTVFTTHKTLIGPRGAVILTTDARIARKIDNAVFPGSQGGPHLNKMAALCTALKIAQTEEFSNLQHQILKNAQSLAEGFKENGLRVVYGGTDTHIVIIDISKASEKSESLLYGEPAARILDIAGIVINKNTIPGDSITALARGLRYGTPWVTQIGLDERDMKKIANITADIVKGIEPYQYIGLANPLPRGKIEYRRLKAAKDAVRELVQKAQVNTGYTDRKKPDTCGCSFRVIGERASVFLQSICTGDISPLQPGDSMKTLVFDGEQKLMAPIELKREENDSHDRYVYLIRTLRDLAADVIGWFEALSDGYVFFDSQDVYTKIEGPVIIREADSLSGPLQPEGLPAPGTRVSDAYAEYPQLFQLEKSFFLGRCCVDHKMTGGEKTIWTWQEPEHTDVKTTLLYNEHKKLGGKMIPFAGWEMPVWYTSTSEEHWAVRNTAGLFDVSHMGCFEVSGPNALPFLDLVNGNYITALQPGESCYSHLFNESGECIDDLLVYRLEKERYMLVVNAANERKDFNWLKNVNEGRVIIDRTDPARKNLHPALLRDLKSDEAGNDQLRGIALQGPLSTEILLRCTADEKAKVTLLKMRKAMISRLQLKGMEVLIAMTGYTGENNGYELYIHPDKLLDLWNLILEAGKPMNVAPCGLGARDSLRTEAGLPLYGHELAGPENLTPMEAGFGGYVKFHKPFFIGRKELLDSAVSSSRAIVHWRMKQKGVRRPNPGNPVVSRNGVMIGRVTSCSLDSNGVLNGLAVIESKHNIPRSTIGIYPVAEKPVIEKQKFELNLGDKVQLYSEAEIVSRFRYKLEDFQTS